MRVGLSNQPLPERLRRIMLATIFIIGLALAWLGYETDGLTVQLPCGKAAAPELVPAFWAGCMTSPYYKSMPGVIVSTASWREARYSMEVKGFEGACGPAGCTKEGHGWWKRNMLAMKDADKPYRVKVRDRVIGKKSRLIEVPIERAELYH